MPRFDAPFIGTFFGTMTLVLCLVTCPVLAQPERTEPPASPTGEQPKPKEAGPKTVEQKLDACKKLYASARTYRDEGEVKSDINAGGTQISDTKPFATAFERDGRFRWQFTHSRVPGSKPTEKFVVWSMDQKSFQSSWTLQKGAQTYDSLDMAMAGPTGVSGGSATAVIPLLRQDMRWGIRTTDLTEPVEKGKEQVDGVECTRIEGKQFGGAAVTLWLDPSFAIRKIYTVQEIDPSKMPNAPGGPKMDKFTTKTTITFKPILNEKIDDKLFEPPEKAK
jgi:hypothetical protein